VTSQDKAGYYWGVIAPRRGEAESEVGSHYEPLLPSDVATLSNVLGITDYTVDSIEDASVQLGSPRVLELIETTQRDFGVVADTAGEAVIAAMHHLGVRKIAVGSRWADEVNTR
jgi:maleate cis-trans isomerase